MTESRPTTTADRPPVLDAIGHTPIVRLAKLVGPGMAEVWVKVESHNPTEGRRVVTVLVDSGLKYLGGSLYA